MVQKDEGILREPSNLVAGEAVAYKRYLFSAQAPVLTTSEHYATNKMGV
jgi:hypothetical protein